MDELVADLDRGRARRVAFAVPSGISWPLGLYELALLCAARVREVELPDVELTLVTPEARPLEIFGPRAGEVVSGLLERAGIAVRLAATPVEFADCRLRVAGQASLACDRVVALPRLEVPLISGLPQERDGFLAVDRFGAVFGAEHVFAAGDVTWFPVKQGGIATQMADSAASAIASLAAAPVDPQPFQPVLRGAILTESGPRYLRTSLTGSSVGEASGSTLWWPPAKIAGKYLAPYLAGATKSHGRKQPLKDLGVRGAERPEEDRPEHEDVVAIALSSAEAHAREHDYPGALRWLEVAEQLDLYLPSAYEAKRAAWLELA
jgi:sulfide:quinone oxidoreductase